jgi:hypothetical protein
MSGPEGFEEKFRKVVSTLDSIDKEVKVGEPVFKMNEDGTIDEKPEKKVRFPPCPVPYRKWFDDDEKHIRYHGDIEKYNLRVQHKLYMIWMLWYNLRTNQKLEEILATEEKDKESHAYICKATIVDIIDHIAKIMVNTPLVEEIMYLFDEKKE